MKTKFVRKLLCACILLISWCNMSAQFLNYRVKFRYKISQTKLTKLNTNKLDIVDDKGNKYKICGKTKLKCLITQDKDGNLQIDPWSISDPSTNPLTKVNDPCLNDANTINSNTPNSLMIKLKRDKIGDPTKPVWFPYQSIILSVNVIGLKVRPSVRDYNDSLYSISAAAASINLGLSLGYSFGWTQFTHRSNYDAPHC